MNDNVKIIDLSVPISSNYWEPDPIQIEIIDHVSGADKLGKSACYFKRQKKLHRFIDRFFPFSKYFIDHRDFPDQMGLSQMFYRLSTHTGTHIDAPFHYGWRKNASCLPKTISEIPLEWCFGNGILLDYSNNQDEIDAQTVAQQCQTMGVTLSAGDIILINTGANRNIGLQDYFLDYRPIRPCAVSYFLDRGIKVVGTDAFSFDPPFLQMISAYYETGDQSVLWPAHILGRDRPYLQIERLGNLEALPQTNGFKVCCMPIKLEHADAAWSRVVAIFEKKSQ